MGEVHEIPRNPNKPRLSVKQIKFLETMAAGYSIRKSAKIADIDYTTIYDWKRKSPDFLQAYNEVIELLWVQAKEGIKSLANQSIKVLSDVMKSKQSLDKDKLVAAKTVIDNIHKFVVDDELRKRVESLLTKLEADNGHSPAN